MDEWIRLGIPAALSLVTVLVGLWVNRRLGISDVNKEYVSSLKGLNDSYIEKLKLMEDDNTSIKALIQQNVIEITGLKKTVDDLKQENVDLRVTITNLKRSNTRLRRQLEAIKKQYPAANKLIRDSISDEDDLEGENDIDEGRNNGL